MRHSSAALASLSLTFVLAAACTDDPAGAGGGGDDAADAPDGGAGTPAAPNGDPLEGLPTGAEAWAALCDAGHQDAVSRAFCQGSRPSITSLYELRAFLGLGGVPGDGTVSATGVFHSTSISGRFVTPLNPRMFFMTPTGAPINPSPPRPMPSYTIVGFARGEVFAELAAKDPVTKQPRFFLFRFELPCEASAEGCSYADLLTPDTEAGWTDYSIYADDAIKNTTLDCLRCHQPDGPGGAKFLRMQELRNPWNHWLYEEKPENLAAIVEFEGAHLGEAYASMPADKIRKTRPIALQRLIQNNGPLNQPNEYDSTAITAEVAATGTSPTWDALYAEAVAGRAMPVPYAGNPQTDPTRLAAMKQAYVDTMNGDLPRAEMPDIRDTFLDAALVAMGYRARPGQGGVELMTQMCGQCHNSRLDQTIARARFNPEELATMSRVEKDKAIARLQLPDTDRRKMPPPRFETLTDAERALVIAELSQ